MVVVAGLATATVVVSLALAPVLTGARPAQQPALSRRAAATLARRAVTDDGALARLRGLERVGEAPVDLRVVLADLRRSDRRARLASLARELGAGPAGGADRLLKVADARARARDVLEGRRYQRRDVPRPFRGALRWLADRLRPLGRVFDSVSGPFADLLSILPSRVVMMLLAVLLGLAGWWLAMRRSGTALEAHGAPGTLVDPDADPADLDHQADAAEAEGDLDAALRLRYQGGLLRLVRAGRLTLRADTTASGAAAHIGDATMDSLTADFEAVAYGGRRAAADDVARARSGWADLVGARSRA